MRARRVLLALFLLAAPAARAQVGADWTAATGGSIRPGYDLNPCSAANSGALRYNTTVNQFQACYGSGGWATLADASGTTPFYTDRITSGTAGIFVSNTGVINFRTGGVTTGYFDASGLLVTPGISITSGYGISSTSGSFSGTSTTLRVSQNGSILNYSPNLRTVALFENTSSLGTAIDILAQNTGTSGVFFSKTGGMGVSSLSYDHALRVMKFYLGGGTYGAWTTSGLLVGINNSATPATASTTLHVSGTLMTTSWTGINVFGKPNAPLEVSGTISATAFVGNGAGLTGLSAGDRITSGTAGVFVSNTGVINFRTDGVTTGYFDASGLLVAPGISITTGNGISSTNGYFSGAVVNAPQANAGTSIDWSRGNVQYTSASCGAFTFTNMQDGGVYSLTVKGTTAGTCSFSQSGLTFRMPPNHGMVSTGTMTFYTFTRTGSDVMVNWMPGY